MAAAIEAGELSKRFGTFAAVKGVSFSVNEGEIFGFLGPNGAGKSTTINMLTTLLVPSGGAAKVAGIDLLRSPEKVRERICLISQEGSVDGELTAEENLEYYGRLYHVPGKELPGRVKRALEFVSLSEKAKVPVKFFSGGMKRRLEIAKVFITEPKIIFLDEPTIGLDPQSRESVWRKIFEINRTKGITIFITTHYMQEAEALCNRIAIIDHGKLIAVDTPSRLRESIGIGEIIDIEVSGNCDRLSKAMGRAGYSVEPLSAGKFRVTTRKRGEVQKLISLAKSAGCAVKDVLMRRPSMEDVFLHYTGQEIRDERADGDQITKMIARRMKG